MYKYLENKLIELDIKEVQTYLYRDVNSTEDNVYEKLGFTLVQVNQPTLRYWDSSKNKVFSRQAFQKQKLKTLFPELYDESLTEVEILKLAKIYAFYDTGTSKYIKRIQP